MCSDAFVVFQKNYLAAEGDTADRESEGPDVVVRRVDVA